MKILKIHFIEGFMKKFMCTVVLLLSISSLGYAEDGISPCLTANSFGAGNGIIGINGGLQFSGNFEIGVGYSTRLFSADVHGYLKVLYPINNFCPYLSSSINYLFRESTPAMYPASNGFASTLRLGTDYYLSKNWFIEFDLGTVFLISDEPALKEMIGFIIDDTWYYVQPGVGVGYRF